MYPSVEAALECRAAVYDGQLQSSTARLGFEGSGGRNDPDARMVRAADVGMFLRGLSLAERVALALETCYPHLPVREPARRASGRQSRRSKCALYLIVMEEPCSERRYWALVGSGRARVRRAMLKAGQLGGPAWD